MKLEAGQVAVITGGASGIGFGLAEAFGARGLSVALADIDGAMLDDAVERLSAAGVTAIGEPTDVREPDHLDRLRDVTLGRLGRIDVICNNAGVVASPLRPLWEFTLEEWYWVLDINLRGVIHGLRSFVPHLIAQGSGHVVNTSSMAGLMTVPGIAPYTASKRAVVGLSETLAVEFAQHAPGVGVTVVCPGRVVSRLGVSSELTRPGGDPSAAGGDGDTDAQLNEPGIITAAENAAQVIEAIEADRLHVAPGAGTTRLAKQRVDLLGASLGF